VLTALFGFAAILQLCFPQFALPSGEIYFRQTQIAAPTKEAINGECPDFHSI
jgi:hypothetical protein